MRDLPSEILINFYNFSQNPESEIQYLDIEFANNYEKFHNLNEKAILKGTGGENSNKEYPIWVNNPEDFFKTYFPKEEGLVIESPSKKLKSGINHWILNNDVIKDWFSPNHLDWILKLESTRSKANHKISTLINDESKTMFKEVIAAIYDAFPNSQIYFERWLSDRIMFKSSDFRNLRRFSYFNPEIDDPDLIPSRIKDEVPFKAPIYIELDVNGWDKSFEKTENDEKIFYLQFDLQECFI